MPSHAAFLRQAPPMWTLVPGNKGAVNAHSIPNILRQKCPCVDLPRAASAAYPSGRYLQTLECEACKQLSIDIQTSASSSSPWLQILPWWDCGYPWATGSAICMLTPILGLHPPALIRTCLEKAGKGVNRSKWLCHNGPCHSSPLATGHTSERTTNSVCHCV